MTLSAAIRTLESLIAQHDGNRRRYAIELMAHLDVQACRVTPFSPAQHRDQEIYDDAYQDALARKLEGA